MIAYMNNFIRVKNTLINLDNVALVEYFPDDKLTIYFNDESSREFGSHDVEKRDALKAFFSDVECQIEKQKEATEAANRTALFRKDICPDCGGKLYPAGDNYDGECQSGCGFNKWA